jgi:2-keto-4-pentenoate hydratase/2-oxohepta-3-ene-1,7-dioic acid hydratase in catechol pathway
MADAFTPRRAWFRLAGRAQHEPGPLGLLIGGEYHTLEPLLGAAAFDSQARLADGTLSARGLDALARRLGKATLLEQLPAFGLPVPRPGKLLCLGKNYRAHAAEFGSEAPEEPMFFAKLAECLLPMGGPGGGTVRLPPGVGRVDHEGELCLVLGADGAQVSEADAPRLVAGLTLIDDVTARHMQGLDRAKKFPWVRCKSFDTFGPIGPWVVPFADVFDGGVVPPGATPDLLIETLVNGEVKQSSRTGLMVHGIAATIAYLSRHTTLRAGDLVPTGTPEGVSELRNGDRVTVRCERVGVLEHGVA